MEIRINKEIKDYRESIFFGLTLRQFFCSVIAVGAALGIYFGLKNVLGRETVSWLCIVCAAPFAAAGFFNYNGMTFEQFVVAVIRQRVHIFRSALVQIGELFIQYVAGGRTKC